MAFTEKYLRVPGVTHVAGRRVKRYHVTTVDAEIEDAVQRAAYAFLPSLIPEPDGTPPAAFTVLHRGVDAVYLNAYSWVWDNVLECHTAAAGSPFLGCDDTDVTHFKQLAKPWIGCVWELPPLEHERAAWVRHLLDPDEPDLDAYLADLPKEGMIGR
ncbi:hypothetical protein [Sphaerisporangium sp. TRM90804]|uniref:hypothetical protein n=1 Tax=Sphaerisporangium sp. TRM90804 TaxID=3031113 RepID=UPI002448E64B|nr:hypothetical protein [Sphaerisporangium sp. TRM90804]MDH2425608.1 hypothetical protein [Sphaerisporangium sp. TRM90804]